MASGPLMREWLVVNMILNLEREARCLSPLVLFPLWLKENKFDVFGNYERVMLPAAFNEDSDSAGEVDENFIEKKLGAHMAHWLWSDAWAGFVGDERPTKMWWDNEDVARECLSKGTMIEIRTLFALKPAG